MIRTVNGVHRIGASSTRRPVDVQPFAAPPVGDIAVITSYFNPLDYETRRLHWHTWARGMAMEGVPFYTVEIVQRGHPGRLPKADTLLTLPADAVLWHKERALNVLVSHLPERFTKVAWVDCDMVFPRAGWHREASLMLESMLVVQLFRDLIWLTRDGGHGLRRPGFAYTNQRGTYTANCPGGAWAAHRDLWTRFGGLYDRFIIGGADELAAAAFNDAFDVCPVLTRINERVAANYLKWARPVARWVRGEIGWLDVTLLHLWHGDKQHRQYQERMDAMRDLDPEADIRGSASGLWEWASDKPEMHAGFVEYFRNRREDG